MPNNDVILLAEMVERSRSESVGISASEQETYFLAQHYLKEYGLTHDDILSGIVDGTRDGGVDGAYILVNGLCLRSDTPLAALGRGADLQLVLMQIKNSSGFSESAVEHMITNLPDLLDLGRNETELATRFNPKIIEVSRRFLQAVRDLEMPDLQIRVVFASLKADTSAHPNVITKGDQLESTIRQSFGTCSPKVEFLDAARVCAYARFLPRISKSMQLSENPISTNTAAGYIGVVSLAEYRNFISDDLGRLDAAMFEANVRDYETGSDVNESIQRTLQESESTIEFWWLNNGVTVVADKVQLAGKRLSLTSPQIVNGLQTSHEIYKRGSIADLGDGRSVLVKVIEADREDTKDRIIKATNSQTTLGTSAIRATDLVQRKIEEYLLANGLFYERRKNFYRNRQVPITQLVSIDQMGQAVTSTLVQAPHIARANPYRVFDDDIYPLVFAETHPLAIYSQAITIQRTCEQFLRSQPNLRGEVENYVFHLSMIATIAMTRKWEPKAGDLARLDSVPTTSLLNELLGIVRQSFALVARTKGYVLFEEVSKDMLSTKRVLEGSRRFLAATRRDATTIA